MPEFLVRLSQRDIPPKREFAAQPTEANCGYPRLKGRRLRRNGARHHAPATTRWTAFNTSEHQSACPAPMVGTAKGFVPFVSGSS